MIKPWEEPYSQRFAGRKPKICIGWLAFGEIDPQVFESALFWAMHNGKVHSDKFEVYFAMATRREQYRARNALIKTAQEYEADFMLMLDDDHTLMDSPNMLLDFFEAQKPIQGGLYVQRQKDQLIPVIQRYDPKTGACFWCDWNEIPGGDGGHVDILGGGINWFDMRVFDFMSDPFYWPYPADERKVWFKPHPKYGLDMHFCIKAQETLGIKPWLNGRVKVGHAIHERMIVRPPGMTGHQMCDACDGLMVWTGDGWDCQTCQARQDFNPAEKYVPLNEADFSHREAFRPAYGVLADALCKEFEFLNCLDAGAGQGFLVDALADRGKVVLGVEKELAAKEFMSPFSRTAILIEDFAESAKMLSTFDLVSCVEVAEHVPEAGADTLVDSLLAVAKNQIFFTADSTDTANPHHVNCQPKSYWIEKFAARGWRHDPERAERIAAAVKDTVAPWIARNAMVFIKQEAA